MYRSVTGQIIAGIIALLGIWFVLPWPVKIKLIATLIITGATSLKIFIIKKTLKSKESVNCKE